jgi:magnesium transporter
MLRAYGPGCHGQLIDAERERIPESATWIDLDQPTDAEERLVERCLGLDVPTPEELEEIEPSSRLYERGGAIYMTMSTLWGVQDGEPAAAPIGFVLAGSRLVTVRYVTPKPWLGFIALVLREPDIVNDSVVALVRLLDTIIERLADELEAAGEELDSISRHIFQGTASGAEKGRRIPANRLEALLNRIGRAQALLARIRETAVSSGRLVSFLYATERIQSGPRDRDRVQSLSSDVSSLVEHSGFLANNLAFLLQASLGLISIEQNTAIKVFSVAALVLLPPALVAGIYGMNFDHMPELDWLAGYPWALGLMLASAILPYWWFKRRGWL